MKPGDFIITPSRTWHDHGHVRDVESDAPVVWLGGLDGITACCFALPFS